MSTKSNETASKEAPIMTSSELAKILKEIAADLEIPADTMTNESYGALIYGAAIQYGLIPAASFPTLMQLWTLMPKNPSAMRQLVWKAETSATPEASAKAKALAAKWGAQG